MDADTSAEDRANERTERGQAAHRRAQQAAVRAAELRGQRGADHDAAGVRGSSPAEVQLSQQRADEAADSMLRAFERGAQAHDRAAELHELRARTEPAAGAADLHEEHARQHRDAAEADRDLARKATERRQPPAG
jgi:hypothetical protein